MEAKKILFYSHDTYGLGHIQRVLAISRFIAQGRKVSILVVTGSGFIHHLRIPRGIDYIKLPAVTKIGDDQYTGKYLSLSLNGIIRLREKILLQTAKAFRPDLFVVDNVPLGLKNEALTTLKFIKGLHPSGRTILTMRDILDDGTKIQGLWRRDGVYSVINQYFDAVLVFGQREIYDVVQEYSIPPDAAARFIYCGYINRAVTFHSPESIRSRLNLNINGHPLVLVTVGGGGDGAQVVLASLQALEGLVDYSVKTIVVLGPDFPSRESKSIRDEYARHPHIAVLDYVKHLPDIMRASDLVISMGGYNTICEILSLDKKAIVIPRVEPRVEQLIRVRKLAGFGLLEYIHPAVLSPALLRKKIRDFILNEKGASAGIDLKGLERSREVFQELLSS